MQKNEVKVGDQIHIQTDGEQKLATVTRVAGPDIVSVELQNSEAVPVGGRLYEYNDAGIDGTWSWPKKDK